MVITCASCDTAFEASRSSVKFCSDRCRGRSHQRGKRTTPGTTAPAPGLVAAVRGELEAAGRQGSYAGQLAVELAQRMVAPGETGIASLSKELRTVMDSALGGGPVPAAVEDEVDRARKARDKVRRSAGGRSPGAKAGRA